MVGHSSSTTKLGVNGFMGGAFGQGLDENIRLAYEWLTENYKDGDEIFYFRIQPGRIYSPKSSRIHCHQRDLESGVTRRRDGTV